MLKYVLSAVLLFPCTDLCAQQQTGAPATDIIGSWRLVAYEDRDSGGVPAYPYGRAPAGLLVYDATGHMAIQIMKQPPPDVASDDWDKFTVSERVALYDGYVAYFGRYEVDASKGIVIHLPEADLSRLYIGRREVRHFVLDGDNLVLSERWTQSGKEWKGVRRFARLK